MYKKIEKTECDGLQKAIVYLDKTLKRPYLVVTDNVGALFITAVSTAEQAYNAINIGELRCQFTVEEIANIRNYVKIEEKSNAEVWSKYEIPYMLGGRREGAGRPFGAKGKRQKEKYSDRTELFNKRLTKEEKAFLEEKLKEFRFREK